MGKVYSHHADVLCPRPLNRPSAAGPSDGDFGGPPQLAAGPVLRLSGPKPGRPPGSPTTVRGGPRCSCGTLKRLQGAVAHESRVRSPVICVSQYPVTIGMEMCSYDRVWALSSYPPTASDRLASSSRLFRWIWLTSRCLSGGIANLSTLMRNCVPAVVRQKPRQWWLVARPDVARTTVHGGNAPLTGSYRDRNRLSVIQAPGQRPRRRPPLGYQPLNLRFTGYLQLHARLTDRITV